MLHGLGRWLRAAGYDTVTAAGGLSDRALAARCAEEGRVLLTKDRRLAKQGRLERFLYDDRSLDPEHPLVRQPGAAG
jgi:uncharacterized protein with PIN domain